MKSLLLLFNIIIPIIGIGQITFEEITNPDDFNIGFIQKSPIGEYFVQTTNDRKGIYTSMNGIDWNKTSLTYLYGIDELQFFNDGTPIIKSQQGKVHTIRRNGSWQILTLPVTNPSIDATCISGDTLFVFAYNQFAYSLDKGQSFTTVFEMGQGLTTHTSQLWKFNQHFILYYGTGALKFLTAYTLNGDKLFTQNLSVDPPEIAYHPCGELLIIQKNKYYRLQDQGLNFEEGNTKDIMPGYTSTSDLSFANGNYYYRLANEIYKSNGCSLSWEAIAEDDLIESKSYFRIGQNEEIILFNLRSNYFTEKLNGSNNWTKNICPIHFPLVYTINENKLGQQQTITSNAQFNKQTNDPTWVKIDSTVKQSDQIRYAPNGDLYIKRDQSILHSVDNGHNFNTINLPDPEFQTKEYWLHVLGNNILFIHRVLWNKSYYSLNNGKDWKLINLPSTIKYPFVKLVQNRIVIADMSHHRVIYNFNLATDELITFNTGPIPNIGFINYALSDDGKFYFYGQADFMTNTVTLHAYDVQSGMVAIGDFEELFEIQFFTTSGNTLHAFHENEYYVFDNGAFTAHDYINLPKTDKKFFVLADNEVLYAILDDNRIFRSTMPLSFPQYISGSIFTSPNLDCVLDTTAVKLSNWQVKVESNDFKSIKNSGPDGRFNFSVPPGDYTLSSHPISTNWALCTTDFNIVVDENTIETTQDFIAKALTDCAELQIDFSTPFLRRCFDNYYSIKIRNTGPSSSEHSTLTLLLDPFFDVLSASLPYTQLNDSTLVFDLGTLALNEVVTIQLFFNLSCEAAFSAVHCLKGILHADNLCDVNQSHYTECQESIGSYDPNDKRIFDAGGRETTTIDKNDYIYYHIRFQNTGTDTAFNIVVEDPLSAKLDLSTLEMLSSSHPYDFYITERPTLVVNFDNVLLVDSTTNEPASHGYFKFRIKPLPGFDYGTSITNTAGIYFDFNDPIYTNEALLTIQSPLFTKVFGPLLVFDVYPNPATDNLTIVIADSERQHIDNYAIVNDLGQQVFHSSALINGQIPVHGLTAGKYKLVLKSKDTLVGIKEFVKF